MKKLINLIFALLNVYTLFAQAPQKMSYQAVIRNASNGLVVNSSVRMRISVLQGDPLGSVLYSEIHKATTNVNGLVSVEIGAGINPVGNFSTINWSNGTYFLKTETDPNNGTDYSIIGTSQLLSVPYALYAANSGSSIPGPQGPKGDQGDKGDPGNGFSNGTANNQIMYWNGTAWVTLNPGSNGQSLTICNGVLTWATGGVCPLPAAALTTLNCAGATNNGTLTVGTAASGVTSVVPYTGGNGGTYSTQTINSTGVTGLTATLAAGTLANGAGTLTYTISGTAATSGTANFALSVGGQSCTLSRTVNLPAANLTTLKCSEALHNGTLRSGTLASGVSSVIPYTGGNGGTYSTQTINSTGVTGLTATLAAGTLLNGAGSLTYTISGTPATSGNASFTLSIGGQSCVLNRTVFTTGAVSGITTHTCGATNVHNPAIPYGNMQDLQGNTYRTVQIGTQIWMAEDLRTTVYRNGSPILSITDNTQWQNNTTGAYCSFNNNTANDCPYGKLYNWYALTNANQLCPSGWHVPTDAEWSILIGNLDPLHNPTVLAGNQSQIAGGKMKSTGTQYWIAPNGYATNSSGFSALPGGFRFPDGRFANFGVSGDVHSSTPDNTLNNFSRATFYLDASIVRRSESKAFGSYVRCVKD